MAALLNNGRTGANAPWEYTGEKPYPTPTANVSDSGPVNPVYYDSGGGGCDAGAAGMGMAAMAAALVLAIKRRRD
jgi:uncharacterized protein (TIGR03382 family)